MLHKAPSLACGLLVLALCTARAAADDIAWNDPSGGPFGDSDNWLPTQVPDTLDTAIFDQDGDYTVAFDQDRENSQLRLRTDKVLFDLGGHVYTLTDTGSVYLGENPLDVADLSIQNGTLDGDNVFIGYGSSTEGTLTIDGVGSACTYTSTDAGYVGTGTLEITNGGSASGTWGYIGNQPTGTGIVKVDGTNSTWSNSQYVAVGTYGTATLEITNGGRVSSASGNRIADQPGSTGSATVDGVDSIWTSSSLYVGGRSTAAGGTGMLTVSNGGTVEASYTLKAWPDGTVNLTDGTITCGTFDNSAGGTFNWNSGTLAFLNNLTVNSATPFGAVGGDAISVGRAVEVANRLDVNNGNDVALDITGGGSLASYTSYIGTGSTEVGTVAVDGVGSTWTSGNYLCVAREGNGTLNITNGGIVNVDADGFIASQDNSHGEVTVEGTGVGDVPSQWNNAENLYVANRGTGTLMIRSGGVVYAGASGYIAKDADFGSDGTITVDGSTLTVDDSLYVGGSDTASGGTGMLTVKNSSGKLIVPNSSGAGPPIVQNDGAVNAANVLKVWDTGTVELLDSRINTGSFLVAPGGTFTHDDGILAVTGGTFDPGTTDYAVDGAAPGDLPTVRLTDGATCDLAGEMTVGNAGAGRLEIASGGSISNSWGYIGRETTSEGAVKVDGAGSSWTNSDVLLVGRFGTGSLAITGGGSVSCLSSTVGSEAGSQGAVAVDGAGSSWANNSWLTVGFLGTSTLEITNGGSVSNTLGRIGTREVSVGTVTVGDGSTWISSGELLVGIYGRGTLAIRDGGYVAATGSCIMGRHPGSHGTVTVAGTDSMWHLDGDLAVGLAGSGTLEINGGTVDIANDLSVSSTSTLDLNGGTLRASGFSLEPGTFRFHYGTLHSTGDLNVTPGFFAGQPIPFQGHLKVDGTTTLAEPVTLDGGTFSTGSLVNPQWLQFTRGTFNLTSDDLAVGPSGLFGDMLTLPSDKFINVTNTINVTTEGTLQLLGGTISAGSLANCGEIRGRGTIHAALSNDSTGVIRAAATDYLELDGSGHENLGQVNLIGGTIEFAGPITNEPAGTISGHGGLIFNDGLTNHGTMNFGADTEIYGDVVNGEPDQLGTDGEIVISGGASVAFHGNVASNGAKFKVSENANVVFFGTLSGVGSITGGGGAWIEGTFSPGNSPGDVLFGGDFGLGPDALLEIELGGTEPGVDYDVLNVLGVASLDGTLDLTLIDGFQPAAGDQFELFNFASQQGEFTDILLPGLSAGLNWDDSLLASDGVLTVVPEPGTFLLAALGLLGLLSWGCRRRR